MCHIINPYRRISRMCQIVSQGHILILVGFDCLCFFLLLSSLHISDALENVLWIFFSCQTGSLKLGSRVRLCAAFECYFKASTFRRIASLCWLYDPDVGLVRPAYKNLGWRAALMGWGARVPQTGSISTLTSCSCHIFFIRRPLCAP